MSEKLNLQKFASKPIEVSLKIVQAKPDPYSHTRYCYGVQNLLAKSLYILIYQGELETSATLEPFEFLSFCTNRESRILPVHPIEPE